MDAIWLSSWAAVVKPSVPESPAATAALRSEAAWVRSPPAVAAEAPPALTQACWALARAGAPETPPGLVEVVIPVDGTAVVEVLVAAVVVVTVVLVAADLVGEPQATTAARATSRMVVPGRVHRSLVTARG
jgi:hypothetical protein